MRLTTIIPALLLAACGSTPDDTTSGSSGSAEASSAETSTGLGSGPGGSTDAYEAASSGTSSTSTASSGEGSGGGDGTGEPAPASCYGAPCSDSAECLPGLRCMTHPGTGEGMCVMTCFTAPVCDAAVSCGAFIPKVVPPVECADGGCFPALCDVLADCPDGALLCSAGLCY